MIPSGQSFLLKLPNIPSLQTTKEVTKTWRQLPSPWRSSSWLEVSDLTFHTVHLWGAEWAPTLKSGLVNRLAPGQMFRGPCREVSRKTARNNDRWRHKIPTEKGLKLSCKEISELGVWFSSRAQFSILDALGFPSWHHYEENGKIKLEWWPIVVKSLVEGDNALL